MEENKDSSVQPSVMVTVSGIIRKDTDQTGQVLLIKCAKFGDWKFPSGRIEPLETPVQALQREMFEELGVKIRQPRFAGYGSSFKKSKDGTKVYSRVALFFECWADMTPMYPDKHEIADHVWIDMDDVKERDDIEEAMKDWFSKQSRVYEDVDKTFFEKLGRIKRPDIVKTNTTKGKFTLK